MSIKKGKSVATKGLVDAAANELPNAIQNESIVGEERGSSTPSGKKRGARYQIRPTLNKLNKTRGDDEVGDVEGESEVFDGEEGYDEGDYEEGDYEEGSDGADVQDEENLSDVFRELREVEKDVESGFYPLIRALYCA
ncbi:hypothetical protein BGW38_007233, partial [Lunasporangiospora selenospora]